MKYLTICMTMLMCVCMSSFALAEDQPAGGGDAPASDLMTRKTLTDNWFGAGDDLKELGITIKLCYNQQFMVNMRGGKETTNGSDFGGSYELDFLLDMEKILGIKGGEFFMRGAKGTYGGDDSDFDKEKIGGLFKTNGDAGTEEPIYVDKWWWRQRLADDRVELRLGLIDSKKDLFDISSVANSEDKQFLNSALVSNAVLPQKKGLGMFVQVWPTDWFSAKAAIIDSDSRARRTGFDTAFHDQSHWRIFYELDLYPQYLGEGILPGNYRIGSWYNPDSKKVYNTWPSPDRFQTGDTGLYMGFDQMVLKECDDAKDKQGVSIFARYGFAHGDVNKISNFWSTGAQYVGLIPERDKDVLGFAVAQGVLSRDYRGEHSTADRETVYEMYYAYEIAPWLILTPDLQVVTNPGGDRDDRDVFVAGIRLRLIF